MQRCKHNCFSYSPPYERYGFIVIASNASKRLLKEFDIPTTPEIFRGSENVDEVAKRFVEVVTGVVQRAENMFKRVLPINMNSVERHRRLSATPRAIGVKSVLGCQKRE